MCTYLLCKLGTRNTLEYSQFKYLQTICVIFSSENVFRNYIKKLRKIRKTLLKAHFSDKLQKIKMYAKRHSKLLTNSSSIIVVKNRTRYYFYAYLHKRKEINSTPSHRGRHVHTCQTHCEFN